jgi:diguanylate cyclase (GGDEF)-like protein
VRTQSSLHRRFRNLVRDRLAQWLPPLTFAEPLETQYRAWHVEHSRERVHYSMLPAMSLVLILALAGGPLHTLRETLFAPTQMGIVDLLRFAVVIPTCVAMLLVTYTKLYSRWFSYTAPIVALLQGLCLISFDLLMHPQGYSLSAVTPLMVLSIYMLFGMLQYQATSTAIAFVVAYGLAGVLADVDSGQRRFDVAVSVAAVILGFFFHYGFARTQRQNWFRNVTLADSVNRDALTNIANRRMFDDHIGRLWNQAVRAQAPVALLLVDLDHFKAFNDHAGHQAGDACLARVAAAIARSARRPLDLAARYGGEEFVVLLFDVRRERVEELCLELHENIAALAISHPAAAAHRHVTVSIGAACIEPLQGRHQQGLIQLADEALYAAKEGGRNRTVLMDREYETLTTGSFRVPRKRERHQAA